MSRQRWRVGLCGALGVAVLGLPAVALADEPVATEPVPAESAQVDEERAREEATDSGERVEIETLRAENETWFANPDGSTTTDIHSESIRVLEGDDWVAKDLDLGREDGRLVPDAGPTDVTFSAGGDRRLVTLDDGEDTTFSLDWPEVLPTPVVVGATAEYRGVLPDVDLLMTATDGGYNQILRINNRAAADDPRLDALRFGTKVGAGASIVKNHGGFDVVGADGQVAFQAPAPKMWDSSGAVLSQAAPAPTDQRSEGAREGAEVREMDLDLSRSQLVIEPDHALLDDPATVFPVFIDPQTEKADRSEWTMVQKEYPSSEFYKWANDTGYGWGEGVGHQDASGVSTKRLIWEFNLAGIPDAATVSKASLKVDETHSWSCTKAAVNLDRVGRIGSGTNWSNQPNKINGDPLASSNVQVRINNTTGGACEKSITPIKFGLDAGDTLHTAVKNSLDENAIALRLSANESSSTGWKRFENDAVLSITHNRPPAKAVESLTDVETPRGCGSWVPSRTALPTMSAKVTDPDPGETVDAIFSLERVDAGAWTTVATSTVANLANGATIDRPMVSTWAQKSGAWFDGSYRFRAYGRDSAGATGPWSDYCTFYLDSWDPVIHQVTATVKKPDDTVEPVDFEQWVPRDRIFTFVFDGRDSNNLAVSDVIKYVVTSDVPALNNKTISVATGADGTLPIASSDVMGEHWITVRAYDRAGRVSAAYTQNFRVQGAVETAKYEFDEGTGSTLAGIGDVTPPTLTRSASGTSFGVLKPGEPELGVPGKFFLTFDGTGTATVASPVAKTSAAFSVAAWVRAADVSIRRVIVSQTSATGQTFALGVQPCTTGTGTCAFFSSDNYSVESDPVIQVGHWYVIAGSFDDMAAQRRLKVWVSDGLDVASEAGTYSVKTNATLPAGFAPAVSTASRIGSEQLGGFVQSYWVGDIEDVVFYSDEIAPVDLTTRTGADNPNRPLL